MLAAAAARLGGVAATSLPAAFTPASYTALTKLAPSLGQLERFGTSTVSGGSGPRCRQQGQLVRAARAQRRCGRQPPRRAPSVVVTNRASLVLHPRLTPALPLPPPAVRRQGR